MLRGTWEFPRPGIEPVSPALAGEFLTTVAPGKSQLKDFVNGSRKWKKRIFETDIRKMSFC